MVTVDLDQRVRFYLGRELAFPLDSSPCAGVEVRESPKRSDERENRLSVVRIGNGALATGIPRVAAAISPVIGSLTVEELFSPLGPAELGRVGMVPGSGMRVGSDRSSRPTRGEHAINGDNETMKSDPTSVFALTKEQLRPVVEEIAGEPVQSFDISVEHRVAGPYGVTAEKVIPTFAYTTRSGRTGRMTLFAKRPYQMLPGHGEEHHYRYLAEQGAPIPNMYGALADDQQREILFLEYLDVVTEPEPCTRFLNDLEQFPKFVSLVAHFNAIRPSGEYAARLRRDIPQRPGPPGWDWRQRMEDVCAYLDRIWEHGAEGDLGTALKHLCAGSEESLGRLRDLAMGLVEPVSEMETGFTHNDCYPHCTGYRRETGELLIFDLEHVGFEPRFFDIAPWLGAPDHVQSRCVPREELAQYYLEEYARCGGGSVSLDQFLEGTHILWLTYTFMMLGWYVNQALQGPTDRTKEDSEEYRRWNCEELQRQLSMLCGEVR
ncbi:MAG: phosphotransferase [Armatimonadota bacterium]|nr:MAG: phosphotransferase [Armatimonadota bacterium]